MVFNGIYYGIFCYEMGMFGLDFEYGYQFDFSLEWECFCFFGMVVIYFNYFDNYIYLGLIFLACFLFLLEFGQIFQYWQDDVIYIGFEVQYDWDFFFCWCFL